MRKLLVSSAILAAFATPAFASPIAGLYSTGVDNSGNLLAVGTVDTHYAFGVVTGPQGSPMATGTPCVLGMCGVVAPSNVYPGSGPWVPNTPNSQWLAPTADAATTYDANASGYYTWTEDFNLAKGMAASFSGQWAADNTGYATLNGHVISTIAAPQYGYKSFTALTDSKYFVAGNNVLQFVVTNQGPNPYSNPTGIQVDITSSQMSATPLPAAALLFGSALVGGGVFSRKRKTDASSMA